MGFQQFHPTGYLGPADGFHKYGTGPSPQHTASDYTNQQQKQGQPVTQQPRTGEPRNPFSAGGPFGDQIKKLLGGMPPKQVFGGMPPKQANTTYEFMDEFRDSPFYKDAGNYSGMRTMDQRFNPFTGRYGGSSDFNRYKHAYDQFNTERSKPADFDENQPTPDTPPLGLTYDPSVKPLTEPGKDQYQPTQQAMDLARQRFNQNRFQPQPFMGQMGGMFGSPFGGMMGGGYGGGYGRPPMMGGYGSPYGGGLGMFGMSPYGGYGGHGMFGGMMNPSMGGMGGMFGRSGRGQMLQQQMMQQYPYQQQPTQQQPTQQPFQQLSGFGGGYGSSMNNMQQMNPFMGGLGGMFGNMFGGGMTQNTSNQQSNVSQ